MEIGKDFKLYFKSHFMGNHKPNWKQPSRKLKKILTNMLQGWDPACNYCGEEWDDCTCMCDTCFGDYNHCRGNKQRCKEFTEYLEQFCDCCAELLDNCHCMCDCGDYYKECKLECRKAPEPEE